MTDKLLIVLGILLMVIGFIEGPVVNNGPIPMAVFFGSALTVALGFAVILIGILNRYFWEED